MRVVWSRPSLEDLYRIDAWLVEQSTPESAVRTLSAIRLRAAFLERFPLGGRPIGDRHRILRVFETPYLIRYRITDGGVEVVRVHHEREEWQVAP